ncbi:MAG: DNA translocase FtsK 4TM domain-containing protein, partial [Bacteroidales bacterium]|nr:DNA translocase FtsK 4TM domain-containing protein [Bacteroidales bacterium]
MAKKKNTKTKVPSNKKKPVFDERFRFIIGIIISGFALYLLISFISYLLYWKADFSFPDTNTFSNASYQVANWGGKLGHRLSKLFISHGFGLGSFLIPIMIGLIGAKMLKVPIKHLFSTLIKLAFAIIIASSILSFGFVNNTSYLTSGPGGDIGHYIVTCLNSFVG